MQMEIALYARVSINRPHQNQIQNQTQSVDQQIERLLAHMAKEAQIQHPQSRHLQWHLAQEHIYRDDGYSGARLNRPGLDQLREHAAMAAFQIVLITTPDRLARNYVHQVLLLDELKSKGCEVVFLEHLMSDDPHDQLLLQVRGAVAEYERTLITDRMRRGRQAKLRSGQLLPWTRQPYGYLLDPVDPDHPRNPQGVRVDPVKSEVVKQIFAWYTDLSAPESLYKVSQRLTALQIPTPGGGPLWKGATVRLILNNPTYTGTVYVGRTHDIPSRRRKSALHPAGAANQRSQRPVPPSEWIALPAIPVPALVSEEIFALAQARLEGNKRMASRIAVTTPSTSICSEDWLVARNARWRVVPAPALLSTITTSAVCVAIRCAQDQEQNQKSAAKPALLVLMSWTR